jgi:hypothetical protein
MNPSFSPRKKPRQDWPQAAMEVILFSLTGGKPARKRVIA